MSDEKKYEELGYVSNVECDDEEIGGDFRVRKILVISTNKDYEKEMIILMMNPSKANKEIIDSTVERVLEYGHNKYKKITILNVIPLYESSSNNVNKKRKKVIDLISEAEYKKIVNENYVAIKECIDMASENVDIYLATGNPLSHEGIEFMEKIYNNVLLDKKVYAFKSVRNDSTFGKDKTKKGFTFHPSRQGEEFMKDSNRYSFIIKGYDKRIEGKEG